MRGGKEKKNGQRKESKINKLEKYHVRIRKCRGHLCRLRLGRGMLTVIYMLMHAHSSLLLFCFVLSFMGTPNLPYFTIYLDCFSVYVYVLVHLYLLIQSYIYFFIQTSQPLSVLQIYLLFKKIVVLVFSLFNIFHNYIAQIFVFLNIMNQL